VAGRAQGRTIKKEFCVSKSRSVLARKNPCHIVAGRAQGRTIKKRVLRKQKSQRACTQKSLPQKAH